MSSQGCHTSASSALRLRLTEARGLPSSCACGTGLVGRCGIFCSPGLVVPLSSYMMSYWAALNICIMENFLTDKNNLTHVEMVLFRLTAVAQQQLAEFSPTISALEYLPCVPFY